MWRLWFHECRNANVSSENSNLAPMHQNRYSIRTSRRDTRQVKHIIERQRESKLRSTQWPHWMRRRWVIERQYGTGLSAGTQGGINQFSIKQNIQYRPPCKNAVRRLSRIYANVAFSVLTDAPLWKSSRTHALCWAHAFNIHMIFLSCICIVFLIQICNLRKILWLNSLL